MFSKAAALSTLFASSLILASLLAATLSRGRAGERTRAFAGLCAASLVYSVGYILELVSLDLQTVLLMIRFEYLGIVMIAPFLVLVTREFMDDRSRRLPVPLLFAVPVLTVILVATMNLHQLYYKDPTLTRIAGLSFLQFGRGPAYWLHITYQNLVIAYCVLTFIRHSISGPRARRAQARLMLAGCLLPWTGFVLYLSGRIPLGIDPIPVTLSLTGVLFAVGFFRHRLFDLRPIARDTVFEQMRDAVLVTDDQGIVVDHNTSAGRIFPALEKSPGMRDIRGLAPDSAALAEAMARTGTDSVVALKLPDGERRYALHHSSLTDRSGQNLGTAHVFMDISERLDLEERLTILAATDELTGIANRRHFFETARTELERAERYGRPFGVAILDLDDFKAINDNHGHQAGDEALCLAARLCSQALRNVDIMGRLGGDEFAFAFPECEEEGAREAAERLARIVSAASFNYGETPIRLSASVGFAGSSTQPMPDLDTLLKLADERMYANKGRKAGYKSSTRKQGRE